MEIPRTQEDLERYIRMKVEENLHLDYKGAGALDRKDIKKKEITKDVSAMANAAGGLIIYGIREHGEPGLQHLPSHIDPIDTREYSREWLDEVIGHIQPRIPDVEIIPIPVRVRKEEGYCYVVSIPQSDTAHQASDLRYYRRRNFLSEPIEDYEVRELMNRARNPRLKVRARFIMDQPAQDGSGRISSRIAFRITNESGIMARHYAIVGQVPTRLTGGELIRPAKSILVEIRGKSYWVFKLANSASPIFPGETVIKKLELLQVEGMGLSPAPSGAHVHLTLYADNAQSVVRRIPLSAVLKGWA